MARALRQLAQGNNCYAYGVELDESRAEEAQTRLHRVGFGSFFHSRISHEAFHLLFLNPPYLSVINENGGRSRHEKRFLIESIPTLMYGGLLIYVIPYYRLTSDICRILVDNFDRLSVWRFADAEFKKFKQVAVMGIRKKRGTELQDTLWLEQYAYAPASIPLLSQLPESRYALPAQPLEVSTFKGERFNQKELEQQLRRSDSFAQMMARSELDSGVKRPLLPLSISQIGLIGGSGMINGLIECDTPHIIKGRIIKVVRTESEEKFNYRGDHMGSEIKETISNKMIFNVLTPNGFKALTMKKGDKYAMDNSPARFLPGAVCATPSALKVLSRAHLLQLLERHLRGDWGDTCKNDQIANERAICNGDRIVSWYQLSGKTRVLIITEADRSATTIMLSEEY